MKRILKKYVCDWKMKSKREFIVLDAATLPFVTLVPLTKSVTLLITKKLYNFV